MARSEHTRIVRECAKLAPIQKQRLADNGLSEWPQY